jgi:hypothetical protein
MSNLRWWAAGILCIGCAQFLHGQPIYTFSTNGQNFLKIAFPTPCIKVDISKAYVERTNLFIPTNFNNIVDGYSRWGDIVGSLDALKIRDDTTESYWLSLLGQNGGISCMIEPRLLSETNTSKIIMVCSNLMLEKLKFSSIFEKALFQRDVFQLYYVFINCTNFTKTPLNGSTIDRKNHTASALKELLNRLRLSETDYGILTNAFQKYLAQAIKQRRFEDDDSFNLSKNFLPLAQAIYGQDWNEMRFAASMNRHFYQYGGRSFIRVFARTPGWSSQQFYSYWDNVNKSFGGYVHLSPRVPPLPAKTQLMLVRTFTVLMEDGTVADSTIPEEVLIRAFVTTNTVNLDRNSSDYRGTYYFDYKLNRRSLLKDAASLGLVRILDSEAIFFGFYQDVPDLKAAADAGVVSMRYSCIDCHALVHFGSGTVFSLERPRLKDIAADPYSGDFLKPIAGKNSRYTFGKLNENLELNK